MPTLESMQLQDHQNFIRLFKSTEQVLHAYIRRLVPTQNDASEIAQNTSIVLWQKFSIFLNKYQNHPLEEQSKENREEHFKRWAMAVARFEVLSWRRDKYRDRLVFSENLCDQLATESKELNSTLEGQFLALEKCLKKIPKNRRELVLEAHSARNKPTEIAARIGGTRNGFYQWLHRMRLTLQKCVKQTLATKAYQ